MGTPGARHTERITPAELRARARRLKKIAEQLVVIAGDMALARVPSILVLNARGFERAAREHLQPFTEDARRKADRAIAQKTAKR